MINIAKLEQEFLSLLERWNYDIWFTGTFDRRINEHEAIKKFKRFIKHLNKPNDVYFKKHIFCWIFTERKPWSDRAHVHVLIQGIDPSFSKDIELEWLINFGSAKVKPYNPLLKRKATQYMSEKYSMGWLKSYDPCRINSHWRTHKKVYSKRLTLDELKDAKDNFRSINTMA